MADPSNGVVDRFSSAGAYQCQLTGAGSTSGASVSSSECDSSTAGTPSGSLASPYGDVVDPSTGSFHVSQLTGAAVDQFAPGGGFQSEIQDPGGFPQGLAVDGSNHDVYIADSNGGVSVFDPSTSSLSSFSGGGPWVAVDNDPSSPSYRDVYVDSGGGVGVYDPSGALLRTITGPSSGSFGNAQALAVDQTTGDLYVVDYAGQVVYEFDASGSFIGSIDASSAGVGSWQPFAIAVSASTGDVYVVDANSNVVDIFGPGVTVPDVTTGLATSVTPTSATLNGTVNPDSTTLTGCHFDYGTSTSYGQTAACSSTPSGSTPQAVSADVSGLTPGQTYHFRLVASNSGGTSDGADVLFGPPAIKLQGAGSVSPTGATVSATLNPQNVDTTYHVEYGTTISYGQQVPVTDADIGSGASDVRVTQVLSGLSPDTTYHYRVVASNSAGTTDGADQTFSTTPPALVDVQPPGGMSDATGLSTGSATLNAYIDPQGADTSFHFEYGTTTGYGSSTPTGDAGSGNAPALESASVSGLAANTTYHYRTVVSNSLGSFDGPDSSFTTPPASCANQQFRTGYSANLPDCRAYEQVSPVDKAGYPARSPEAAPDGARIAFTSVGAFGGEPNEGTTGNEYLAARGSAGWSTTPVNPPTSFGVDQGFQPVTLGSSALDTFATTASPPYQNQRAQAILGDATGAYHSVAALDPTSGTFGPGDSRPQALAGDASLSTLIIDSSDALVPADTGPVGDQRLYEVTGATGGSPTLRLLSTDTNGQFDPCPNDGKAGAGLGGYGNPATFPQAVSQDGSRVFYSLDAAVPGCGQGIYQVFARANADPAVQLSAPAVDECTSAACQSAPSQGDSTSTDFEGAAADGSKAFFTTPRQLVNAASEDSTESVCVNATGTGCNLYEYDFGRPAGSSLVDLSAGDMSGLGPQVRGVVKVSADGSHVYFVASGVLSSEPNQLGQAAQAGAYNLYVDDTTTGEVAFVADLCTAGGQSGSVSDSACPASANDFSARFQGFDAGAGFQGFDERADVTPDGRFLVFSTAGQLTGDDQNQAADVYEYDAQTGGLWRVSVGHDGQDQNGNAGSGDALADPGQSGFAHEIHVVSADGQTIVFTSARALQSNVNNGHIDAYEWRQGEVTLVSGDGSANPVQNASLDPSGQDIVFTTDQGLLPQDTDGLADVYDARVGGGFPAPTAAPGPCSGDACQGAPSGVPAAPVAASVSFSGPGSAATPGPGPAQPKVLTRTVRGARFVVGVTVPGQGQITITGAGIKTVRVSVSRAGTYRLAVRLTAKARSALRHKHRLRLKLRIAYAPANGAPASITASITDKA